MLVKGCTHVMTHFGTYICVNDSFDPHKKKGKKIETKIGANIPPQVCNFSIFRCCICNKVNNFFHQIGEDTTTECGQYNTNQGDRHEFPLFFTYLKSKAKGIFIYARHRNVYVNSIAYLLVFWAISLLRWLCVLCMFGILSNIHYNFEFNYMAEEKKVLHMSDVFEPDFVAEMKEVLLLEEKKIRKELASFAQRNPHTSVEEYDADFPNYGDEEDDNAREVADFTVNKTLEVAQEKKLRDVLEALKRIENNTYGICKYTGEPIEKKRLLARPTSSSSVSAKKVLTNEA